VTARRKSGGRKATRNPRGGLSAAGRARLRRTEGAHLRPGVKKAQRDMTPEEMRRKGATPGGCGSARTTTGGSTVGRCVSSTSSRTRPLPGTRAVSSSGRRPSAR
jgi:hypothetical protein